MIPKYRVWDKHKKQMIEWIDLDLSKDSGDDDITVFEPTGIVRGSFLMPVFLQSTGLKDKNGTEIYEGDVLKIFILDNKGPHAKVIFKNGMFGIEDDMFGYGYDKGLYSLDQILSIRDAEIIGNKFEHPHLLEE